MIELSDDEKELLAYLVAHNWLIKGKEKSMQPKPPIGVIPEYIFETQRIQELTRALYEYSYYNPTEMKYDMMMDWTQELFRRLEKQFIEKK